MPLPGSVIHRSKVALTSKRRSAASHRAADPDLAARVSAFEALERSMPAVMTAAAANQAHWEAVASSGLAFSVALRDLYAGRGATPAAPADFGVPEGGGVGAGARPAAGTPAADSRSSVDSYGSSAQGGGAAGAVASTDHAARVLSPSLEVAATAMAGSGSSPSSTPVVLATTASRLASAFMEDVARTRELLTTLQKERVEEDYYEAKVAELLATPGGAGSTSGPRRVPAAAAGSASAVKKAERRAEKLAGNVKKRAEHGRTAVRLRDQAVAAIGRLLAARDPLLDRLLSSFVAAQAARLRDPSYGVMSETVRGRWPHLLSLPPGDGGLAALRQQHFTIHGAGGGGWAPANRRGLEWGTPSGPPRHLSCRRGVRAKRPNVRACPRLCLLFWFGGGRADAPSAGGPSYPVALGAIVDSHDGGASTRGGGCQGRPLPLCSERRLRAAFAAGARQGGARRQGTLPRVPPSCP